jgi:hypothetical protein
MFVGTHRDTCGLHKVCTHVPVPYSLTTRVRTLAEEVAVACKVQRIVEAVILFPVRIRHSQGFSGILSESWLLAFLSQIFFLYHFSLHYLFFLLKRVSKPSRDPGYQYQWSLPKFGLSVFIFYQSLDIRVACTRSACVYMPSISIQRVFSRLLLY